MSETRPAAANSPEAVVEILFHRHGEVVAGTVRAVAGGANRAHPDLVAEVQSELAVAMLAGRFNGYSPGRASFKAYLRAAARNTAVSVLRRSGRTARLVGDNGAEGAEQAAASEPGPERALLDRERAEAVEAALEHLEQTDPLGTRILRARYLDGHPYPQIAQTLGLADVKAVHQRGHRTRRRLAQILQGWGCA